MLYHNYINYNTSVKRRITALIKAKEDLEDAKRAFDKAKSDILDTLREDGGIQKGSTLIEYLPSSTALITDTKRLREDYPDIYSHYRKIQERSEGVKIKQKR